MPEIQQPMKQRIIWRWRWKLKRVFSDTSSNELKNKHCIIEITAIYFKLQNQISDFWSFYTKECEMHFTHTNNFYCCMFIHQIRVRIFTFSYSFCPSVFSSGCAAGSLAVSSGQSALVGSITAGGGMLRHSTWALNSSSSFCSSCLLRLNR